MMKYFIYARKSTEGEDRQVTSIEDQIAECQTMAEENSLEVVDVIEESKSAKSPGRTKFNEMLTRIHNGEANGIITWKLNRLARNPIDGSQIIWLLQEKNIKHVKSVGQNYYPTDNLVMMYIEFGMASQYSKDLSVDIRRGQIKKAERGWFPFTQLPTGYTHSTKKKIERGEPEIVLQKEKADIIKTLWKELLKNHYPIAEIKRRGDILGLRGHNGRLLSESGYYRLFRNNFYCGYFSYRNEKEELVRVKGKHKSIVSVREFKKTQQIIEHFTKKRISTTLKGGDYLGIFTCSECSCSITIEIVNRAYCKKCRCKFSIKNKDRCIKCNTSISQQEQFTFLNKSYYRCTKRKGFCSQKYIPESELEEQIIAFFYTVQIDTRVYNWCLKYIKNLDITKSKNDNENLLKKRVQDIEKKLNGYAEMRASKEINSDEYRNFTAPLKERLLKIKTELENMESSYIDWKAEINDTLNFTQNLVETFKNSDKKGKRMILLKLGSNPTIFDKKALFTTPKRLSTVKKIASKMSNEKSRIEPKKTVIKQHDLLEINLPLSPCGDGGNTSEHS
jgi:site-specific DNA recombinase